MKYAQLVIGPAGSGKSTYCAAIQKHGESTERFVQVVNLDPASEVFNYNCAFNVRDLISIDDLAEDEDETLSTMGPNGSLVFCMEYIANNIEELENAIDAAEDDYYLFDCPGQIELYSHMNVMRTIVDALKSWDFNICAVFLLDSQFMVDVDKYMAGALTALSTLMVLECPAVCVLTKMDLLKAEDRERVEHMLSSEMSTLLNENPPSAFSSAYRNLSEKIASVMDSYSMVSFQPLDLQDEESISDLLLNIDNSIQYGEDADVKDKFPEEVDPDEDTGEW
uniref:GPN-loop GTPase 3 n=1 Tax=Panagrolaimus sp. PS1159 TaxID=55785 RepID=A0AC35GAS3_9BILA